MRDFDFEELDKAVSSAIGGAPARDVTPPAREPIAAPAERVTPPVVTPSPATRRATGRFMDVIHPSSDMRTAERPTPVVVREDDTSVQEQEGSMVDLDSSFDHLSFEENVPAEEPVVAPNKEEAEEPSPVELPQSPFLADAVIEKRPLGAMPPAVAAETDPSALLEEGEVQDLLDEGPEIQRIEQVASTPVTDSVAADVEKTAPPAIYDTENYHEPLKPVKKKSNVMVIVWIFVLALLGVGAGVGAYLLILPNL